MPTPDRPLRHVVLPLDVPGANTAFASATARAEGADWRGAAGLPAEVSVRTGAEAGADTTGAGADDVVLSAAGATGVHVVYAVRSLADLEAAGGVTPLLAALDAWTDHVTDQVSVVAGRPASDAGAVLRLLGMGGRPVTPPSPPSDEQATTLVRLMQQSLGEVRPLAAGTADRGCADAGAYLDWARQREAAEQPAEQPVEQPAEEAGEAPVDLLAELRRFRVTLIGDDTALTRPSGDTAPGTLPLDLAAGAAIAIVQGVFDLDPAGPGPGGAQPLDSVPARELATRLLRPRGGR